MGAALPTASARHQGGSAHRTARRATRYSSTNYSTTGLDFAFIKITEGTSYTNAKWVAQHKTAREAGLVTGFHHFVRPGSMTKQADFLLSKITLCG